MTLPMMTHIKKWWLYILSNCIVIYLSSLYILLALAKIDVMRWITSNGRLDHTYQIPVTITVAIIFIVIQSFGLYFNNRTTFLYSSSKKMLLCCAGLFGFLFLRSTPVIYLTDSPYFSLSAILGSEQILIPVLAIAWAYILYDCFKQHIKQSVKISRFTVIALIVIGTTAFVLNSISPYMHFQAPASDVGLFNQVFWNYARFHTPMSTIRGVTHIWADHFHPTILLMVPFYWIFKGPLVMLIIQGLVASSGMIPIYLIIKKIAKNNMLAIAGMCMYLFYSGLHMGMNFGFYPENMGGALFAWAFWFIYQEKYIHYFIFLILWIGLKESIPLHAVFFGLYLFFSRIDIKKAQLVGIATILIGIIWFIGATKIIIPAHANDFLPWAKTSTQKYIYFNYKDLGDTPSQFIKSVIKNPFYTFYLFFHPATKLYTILTIAASFGFLFFASPLFIASLPMFMENFLSSRTIQWQWSFHYQVQFSAILALASVFGVIKIAQKYKINKEKIYSIASIYLILCSLFTMMYTRSSLFGLRNFNWSALSANKEIINILDKIPSNASVSAQNTLAPYVSQRDVIYLYPRTDGAQYIVLAPSYNHFPLDDDEYTLRFNNLLQNKEEYRLVESTNTVYLFKHVAD